MDRRNFTEPPPKNPKKKPERKQPKDEPQRPQEPDEKKFDEEFKAHNGIGMFQNEVYENNYDAFDYDNNRRNYNEPNRRRDTYDYYNVNNQNPCFCIATSHFT